MQIINVNAKWQHWIFVSYPIQFWLSTRWILRAVSTGALPSICKFTFLPHSMWSLYFHWAIIKYQTQFAFIWKVLKLIMIHNWSIEALKHLTWTKCLYRCWNSQFNASTAQHRRVYSTLYNAINLFGFVAFESIKFIIVWLDVLDRVGNVMWPFISGIAP